MPGVIGMWLFGRRKKVGEIVVNLGYLNRRENIFNDLTCDECGEITDCFDFQRCDSAMVRWTCVKCYKAIRKKERDKETKSKLKWRRKRDDILRRKT